MQGWAVVPGPLIGGVAGDKGDRIVSMCRPVTITLCIIGLLSCVTRQQPTDFQMSSEELKAKYQCEYYRCSFGPIGFDIPGRNEYSLQVPHDSKGSVGIEISHVPLADPYCYSLDASKLRISVYLGGTLIKELRQPLSKWWHIAADNFATGVHDAWLTPYCRPAVRESPMTTEFTEQGTVTYRPQIGRSWPMLEKEGLSLDCNEFWLKKGHTYNVVIEVLNSNAMAVSYTIILKVTAAWRKDDKKITG